MSFPKLIECGHHRLAPWPIGGAGGTGSTSWDRQKIRRQWTPV